MCDSCPSVDTIVLIAGLFRALVEREAAALRAGDPPMVISADAGPGRAVAGRPLRAGGRSGRRHRPGQPARRRGGHRTGPLASPAAGGRRGLGHHQRADPPGVDRRHVVGAPAPRAAPPRAPHRRGRPADRRDGRALAEHRHRRQRRPEPVVRLSARQRRRRRRRRTPATTKPSTPTAATAALPRCWRPSPIWGGRAALARGRHRAGAAHRQHHVPGHRSEPGPALPPRPGAPDRGRRRVGAACPTGLGQRARALDAFLRDIYSEQAIVADGIIAVHSLDRAPGFRSTGRLAGDTVRAHISGTDLVCDRAGHWLVLEDNLRVPSGTAYAIVNHRLLGKHLPELQPPADRRPRPGPADASRHAAGGAPAAQPASPRSRCCPPAGKTPPGSSTPSWPRRRASHWSSRRTCPSGPESWCATSAPTSIPSTSSTRGWTRTCCCPPPATTARRCGPGCSARSPTAPHHRQRAGNGVADDKAIYAFVPAMIEYYLGEKPKLAQVPTWICAERAQRDYVLAPSAIWWSSRSTGLAAAAC